MKFLTGAAIDNISRPHPSLLMHGLEDMASASHFTETSQTSCIRYVPRNIQRLESLSRSLLVHVRMLPNCAYYSQHHGFDRADSTGQRAHQCLGLLLVPPPSNSSGGENASPIPAINFFDELEIYPGTSASKTVVVQVAHRPPRI